MSNLQDTLQKLIAKNTQEAVAAVNAAIAQLLTGGLTKATTTEAPTAKAGKTARAPKAAKAGKSASKHKGRAASPATMQRALDAAKFTMLNPGTKAGAIAKHLGVEVSALLGPMTQALRAGWVTKTGERSATVYYPGAVPTELPSEAAAEAPAAPAAGNATPPAVVAPSFSSFSPSGA